MGDDKISGFVVFATHTTLRTTAIEAGFAAEFDLESLCQDNEGNPTSLPPEIRTRIEAAHRARKRLVVLTNHIQDLGYIRVCEILKSNEIRDYQIVVADLSKTKDASEMVAVVKSKILGKESLPKTIKEPITNWEPFPIDALPPPLRRFVEAAAPSFPCDPVMVALPLIVIAGSLIGTTRRLKLKRTWVEYPNLWAAVIAESGSKKTPPFLAVKAPLDKHHGERCREFEAIQTEYEQAKELYEKSKKRSAKDPTCDPGIPPTEPTMERLFVEDTTIEALAPILKESPRGTLLLRDELDGWLSGFERYSGSSDVPSWLSFYNAQSLTVDRKGGGHLYIERAMISIFGCIQPRVFNRSVSEQLVESGLAPRLLCVMPPTVPITWTENELPPALERLWHHLVEDLLELKPRTTEEGVIEPVTVCLSDEAKVAWIEFYNSHGAEQNVATGRRKANLAKLEAICARLALIFSVVDRVSVRVEDTAPIDLEYMENAIRVTRWFVRERDRIEAILDSEPHDETLTDRIAAILKASNCGLTRTAITNHFGRHKASQEIDAALADLESRGLAVCQTEPTAGRPKELWYFQKADAK